MRSPLYQPRGGQLPSRYEKGHAGLWYDKFCNRWQQGSWSLQADGKEANGGKLGWINTLTGQVVGARSELEEMAQRLTLVSVQQGGKLLVVRTESRFVTGLGRSHPVENGFAWHPTLGTPYLPGSSLKGMARAWATTEAEPKANQQTLDRIFGAVGRAGAISFLDALPTRPVKLEADVITPHYAGWNPDDPPGDWRSPVPVPFLVTAAGTEMIIALIPCGTVEAHDLDLVQGWIKDALTWAGAGAKTAVGYGRMTMDLQDSTDRVEEVKKQQRDREEEIQRAARLANLDPLDRALEELGDTEPNLPAWRSWIKAVERGDWKERRADERRVLERVMNAMREARAWKESSNAKKPDKDKDYQYTLKVKDLLMKNQQAH